MCASKPSRFGPPVQGAQIQQVIQQRIPENTKKTTKWCLGVWKAWATERGVREELEVLSAKDLNNYLSHFILKVKQKDGAPYPPDTVYQIVSGLQ